MWSSPFRLVLLWHYWESSVKENGDPKHKMFHYEMIWSLKYFVPLFFFGLTICADITLVLNDEFVKLITQKESVFSLEKTNSEFETFVGYGE